MISLEDFGCGGTQLPIPTFVDGSYLATFKTELPSRLSSDPCGSQYTMAVTKTAKNCLQDLASTVRSPPLASFVNNLGIYESKPFAEITDDAWLRLFEVDVMSGARLSSHAQDRSARDLPRHRRDHQKALVSRSTPSFPAGPVLQASRSSCAAWRAIRTFQLMCWSANSPLNNGRHR